MPADDPLVLLSWLNNNDKHQVPHVIILNMNDLFHSVSVEFQTDEDAALNVPPDITVCAGPYGPGSLLLETKTKTPIVSVNGNFSINASVALTATNGERPVAQILNELCWYVSLVVQQFRGLFKNN